MKFYHGTSEENWEKIQKEGVLWGGDTYHRTGGKEGYRYTYLTPDLEVAETIGRGDVILEVDYKPTGIYGVDNYGFDPPPGQTCWQFSVFISIKLDKVKVCMENKND